MTKVAVVTDSCASIPQALLETLNIHWVPYYVHRGEQVFRDLVTVRPKAFYQWLTTEKKLPTTASPGPGDYYDMYQRLAQEEGATEIVSIHMTSKGSGAYQAAKVAQSMVQEQIPDLRVDVIDTLNVSMCQGWMVIEAARAAIAGQPLSEIADRVREMIPTTQMIQTADTLKYLYMGGRIGRAKHLVGSLLNIKPLIGMQDGVIVPLGQTRSRKQAYTKMADMAQAAADRLGALRIAYVHAAAEEEALKLKRLVDGRLTSAESLIAELSPALGVHTGPGTAGLCYAPVLA